MAKFNMAQTITQIINSGSKGNKTSPSHPLHIGGDKNFNLAYLSAGPGPTSLIRATNPELDQDYNGSNVSLQAENSNPYVSTQYSGNIYGANGSNIGHLGSNHLNPERSVLPLANTSPNFTGTNQRKKEQGQYNYNSYGKNPTEVSPIKNGEEIQRRPYLIVSSGKKSEDNNVYSTEPANALAASVEKHAETYLPTFSRIKDTAKSLYGSIVSGVSYTVQKVKDYLISKFSQGVNEPYSGKDTRDQHDNITANENFGQSDLEAYFGPVHQAQSYRPDSHISPEELERLVDFEVVPLKSVQQPKSLEEKVKLLVSRFYNYTP